MSFLLGLHDPPVPDVPHRVETSVQPRVQPSEIGSTPGSLATARLGQFASDGVEDLALTQKEKEDAIVQVRVPS